MIDISLILYVMVFLELSNRRMYQYDGNYEEFIALKADREAREAATEEKRRQFFKTRN